MPTIRFAKNNRAPMEVEKGANLMRSLLDAGVPVASSCHGDGVCAKCRLEIKEGEQNLPSPNETEKFLQERFQLPPRVRISCQVEVLGDLIVDATYW
jgi:2Fe-2S ferredoxin